MGQQRYIIIASDYAGGDNDGPYRDSRGGDITISADELRVLNGGVEDAYMQLIHDGYEASILSSDGLPVLVDNVEIASHVDRHLAEGEDPLYEFSFRSPTQNDDALDGYLPGYRWIDQTDGYEFILIDNTAGSAVWKNTTLSGISSSSELYDAVVASDGSGDFTDPVAAFNSGAKTVFVKDGSYTISGVIQPPSGGLLIGESKGGVIFDLQGSTSNRLVVYGSPTQADDDFYDGGGTISLTNGSATVTGSSTSFQSASRPVTALDQLIIRGAAYQIQSVDSETQLTLVTNYKGSTESNVAFPDYVAQPMAEDVLIENISITNVAHTTVLPAVQFNQCFNSVMSNVDVSNSVSSTGRTVEFRGCVGCVCEKLTSLTAGAVFGIRNSWRCSIVNSFLTGPQNNGLFFAAASSSLPNIKHSAINVNIEGGNSQGINLGTGSQECLVVGCRIANCGSNGIAWSKEDANHTILNNTIEDVGGNGIQMGGRGFVQGNRIERAGQNGINITEDDGYSYIFANLIEDSALDGILVASGLDNVQVIRNHVFRSDGYGINFSGTPPTRGSLLFNVFRENADGTIVTGGIGDVVPELSTGTRIRWNDDIEDNVPLLTHADTHISGGADLVDGDRLNIDFTPSFYSTDTSPSEVDDGYELTAHLAGIDGYLGILEDLLGLWRIDPSVSDTIKPMWDGYALRLYHPDGVQYLRIERGGGNASLTVGGDDAQALYFNCKKVQVQLGGLSSSEQFAVSDYGDGPMFHTRADHTNQFYGDLDVDGYFQSGGYLLVADDDLDKVTVNGDFEVPPVEGGINGHRHYTSSASDPSSPSPSDGDRYWNTDLNEEMRYDGYRAKWLSASEFIVQSGRSANTGPSAFYRGPGNVPMTSVRGIPVPKSTLVWLGISREDTDTATLDVLLNGVLVGSYTHSAIFTEFPNADIDLSAGRLSFRNQVGSNPTSQTQITVICKRRI